MNNYSMSTVADKLELSSHGVYANWEYGRNEPKRCDTSINSEII